jgi:hypothetical protein
LDFKTVREDTPDRDSNVEERRFSAALAGKKNPGALAPAALNASTTYPGGTAVYSCAKSNKTNAKEAG